MEMTQEQSNQLKTWSSERDAVLLEISTKRTEKEKLSTECVELAESKRIIETETTVIEGRLIELKKKESEMTSLISSEISDLKLAKNTLENEIENLKKVILSLLSQKDDINKDIVVLSMAHDSLKDKTLDLEKIVGHITSVSNDNAREIDNLVSALKQSIGSLISSTEENVKKSNYVIEELPRVFFDVKRQSLGRENINSVNKK